MDNWGGINHNRSSVSSCSHQGQGQSQDDDFIDEGGFNISQLLGVAEQFSFGIQPEISSGNGGILGTGNNNSSPPPPPPPVLTSNYSTVQPAEIGSSIAPKNLTQTHVATGTGQPSRPRNNSSPPVLTRSNSRLSEPDRARKREIDQAYRRKCKKLKEEMQSNFEILTVENGSLKKQNESLKNDNTSMNRTLTEQAEEIERFKSDLFHLKGEYEKQNVLVQTLSGLLAYPVQLENEKLKDENASLRKNGNHHNYDNTALLVGENAKLKLENKVLKVQIDALCGKIISDVGKKHGQEHGNHFLTCLPAVLRGQKGN